MKHCLALLIAMMAPLGSARAADSLGVFDGWAAFRDASAGRCHAIAEPERGTAGGPARAYASVGTWPARGARNQVFVHLSRPQADKSRVYLSIGERRFALVAGPGRAWAQDARMDAAIVSAMRSATTMSVEGTGGNGRAFHDLYVLKGAATAIDAAALACPAR